MSRYGARAIALPGEIRIVGALDRVLWHLYVDEWPLPAVDRVELRWAAHDIEVPLRDLERAAREAAGLPGDRVRVRKAELPAAPERPPEPGSIGDLFSG